MNRRDEILSQLHTIPALPVSATRVLKLIRDPNSSMGDIMKVIEYDPGLTSDVLRLANSAYFAGPRKISSLREAGVLFGTNWIHQMVLVSAIFPLASRPLRGYDLPPGDLLNHLLAVAVATEQLARLLNRPVPSYAFTAGLLHDIGKIVLGTFVEVDVEPIRKLAFEHQVSFEDAERRVLGIDHAEVGGALLDSWQLPENVVAAVRWHHHPSQCPGDSLMADLVHVADNLCIECGLGIGVDGLNYRPEAEVVERLHLRTRVIEQVTCVMLSELQNLHGQLVARGGGNQHGL